MIIISWSWPIFSSRKIFFFQKIIFFKLSSRPCHALTIRIRVIPQHSKLSLALVRAYHLQSVHHSTHDISRDAPPLAQSLWLPLASCYLSRHPSTTLAISRDSPRRSLLHRPSAGTVSRDLDLRILSRCPSTYATLYYSSQPWDLATYRYCCSLLRSTVI